MISIFHIGYPKTGTSWFQKNFFPFVMNAYYVPINEVKLLFIRPNSFEFYSKPKMEEYYSVKKDILIYSTHAFIGTVYNFGINGFSTLEYARRIKKIFPDAIILIFIRRQPDIIASSYVQYIKGGGTWGINKYLYHNNIRGDEGLTLFSFKHFEYDMVINYYIHLFGYEHVKVFLYEEFEENPLKFSKEFANQLKFEINLTNLNYKKENLGYRKYVLYLAKFFNRFTERKMLSKYYYFHIPNWFEFSQKIYYQLNRFPIFGSFIPPAKILGEENLEYINKYYAASNKKLIKNFGLENINKYNYPL